MKRNHLITGLIAFAVTLLTVGVYHLTIGGGAKVVKVEHIDGSPATQAVYTLDEDGNEG